MERPEIVSELCHVVLSGDPVEVPIKPQAERGYVSFSWGDVALFSDELYPGCEEVWDGEDGIGFFAVRLAIRSVPYVSFVDVGAGWFVGAVVSVGIPHVLDTVAGYFVGL